MKHYDCIIIGGGAAGLMCAATAAARGKSTLVLDHSNKVGKKILMSGGGRCNFTNYYIEPTNYLSANKHFCKSALSRFTQWDFIALVDKHGLAYHEKTQGQLFCDNKASDILTILLNECEQAGAEIQTHCEISKVEKNELYELQSSQGPFSCTSLVVATGGLSIPTMGATGFGYELARQFGLQVSELQAGLVPFTISDKNLDSCKALAGVSLQALIECNNQSFNDKLLFTHRGISGPAVLQISSYWRSGDELRIDLLPGLDLEEQLKTWRQQGQKGELKNLLSKLDELDLAKSFIQQWLQEDAELRPCDMNDEKIQRVCHALKNWCFKPSGTEGWRTAEVTLGGIDTNEVSSKTFEAKNVDGLYFIGEVLDVTGWLGGFNFQWAWASGWCAGQYV
ncbi:NAD(P)/FAD-dependent oxidoreductase [Agaribacterium sp. ZY112]|uniref:NAD(P)/FAD-dependent oxidoreductase n=1 Tax=Agaribacterium sp. ZY112 TaxID=3233574 RepID=UPI00352465C5